MTWFAHPKNFHIFYVWTFGDGAIGLKKSANPKRLCEWILKGGGVAESVTGPSGARETCSKHVGAERLGLTVIGPNTLVQKHWKGSWWFKSWCFFWTLAPSLADQQTGGPNLPRFTKPWWKRPATCGGPECFFHVVGHRIGLHEAPKRWNQIGQESRSDIDVMSVVIRLQYGVMVPRCSNFVPILFQSNFLELLRRCQKLWGPGHQCQGGLCTLRSEWGRKARHEGALEVTLLRLK